MHQSIEIDEKIFQDAVKFYGTIFNLPPLASKSIPTFFLIMRK
ncbi:hypothetical protein [Chryseobacterium sp. CH25]|nr:hypothetical protein [Chryseobacterium sp. CH25]